LFYYSTPNMNIIHMFVFLILALDVVTMFRAATQMPRHAFYLTPSRNAPGYQHGLDTNNSSWLIMSIQLAMLIDMFIRRLSAVDVSFIFDPILLLALILLHFSLCK